MKNYYKNSVEWIILIKALFKEYTTATYIMTFFAGFIFVLYRMQILSLVFMVLSLMMINQDSIDFTMNIYNQNFSQFGSSVKFLGEKDTIYPFVGWFKGIYSWIFTISIPFYYFIAREQKSLSESSLNLDRKGLRHFFYTSIIIIAGGYILASFDDLQKEKYIFFALSFSVLSMIFFISSLGFIRHLLQSININYLFFRILDRTNFSFKALLLKKNQYKFFRKKLYDNLNYLIESIYQMLNQSINKGLIKVYSSNYEEWKKTIHLIFKGNRGDIELISKDDLQYSNLYKIILKNQVALIIALYANNRLSEGYDALMNLFVLVPDGDIRSTDNMNQKIEEKYNELMKEYLSTLCGLGLFFYKSNIILHPLILQIKRLPIQRIGIDKIISVYRTWIIKITESCDVKMLVCLSYALMETIEETSQQSIIENELINSGDKVSISQMENLMSKALNVHLSGTEKSVGRCIYILLNAAVKSLEMSQYQCVGFIIKFIVSNFDSKITNIAFKEFISNDGRDNKFDNCEIGSSFGLTSFNLNKKTDKYCLEKLSFLLYGQQVYIKTNNISIRYVPSEYINITECISDNIEYIYNKIIAGKDKFGLIWLGNEKFHKRLFYRILELNDKKNDNQKQRNV